MTSDHRELLTLAFLALCLALALFLPAGSLLFWKACFSLAVWTLCAVLITAYLINCDRELLASRF